MSKDAPERSNRTKLKEDTKQEGASGRNADKRALPKVDIPLDVSVRAVEAASEILRNYQLNLAETVKQLAPVMQQSWNERSQEYMQQLSKRISENLQTVSEHLSAKDFIETFNLTSRFGEQVARSLQSALPSYYSIPELRVVEEPPVIAKDSKASKLGHALKRCPCGRNHWKEYQEVCLKILTHTLVPPLVEPEQESLTRMGTQRRDLIFNIPHDVDGFWASVRLAYKSVGVIVECKNYTAPLKANQVTITSKYLGAKRLGLFGIITCRSGLTDSARSEQVRLWTDEDKMIIDLSDEDLIKMVELRKRPKTHQRLSIERSCHCESQFSSELAGFLSLAHIDETCNYNAGGDVSMSVVLKPKSAPEPTGLQTLS